MVADPAKAAVAILTEYKKIKCPRLDFQTRGRAKQHLMRLLQTHSREKLLRAVRNYGIACAETEMAEQFRRGAGNFFGKYADWEEYAAEDWQLPVDPQAEADRKEQEAYDRIGKDEDD